MMLEQLYDGQNAEGQAEGHKASIINPLRLRAILDNLLEKLPPLLELGHLPSNLMQSDYTFPYHRPSMLSLASKESNSLMPESLGFVLLQVRQAPNNDFKGDNTLLSASHAWDPGSNPGGGLTRVTPMHK